jgi:hypothetical protein
LGNFRGQLDFLPFVKAKGAIFISP